jgi:hypothetical protein
MRERFRSVPHNRLAYEVLEAFRARESREFPVRIEVLTGDDQHLNVKESLKLAAKSGEEGSYVADAVSDYGIVARFPNPFNHSSRVVLLAGLHAPATHAAAFAATDSNAATNLLAYLTRNRVNPDSFVAAFRVERSYLPDRLKALEWLQAEEIVVPLAKAPELPEAETHRSPRSPVNEFNIHGPVINSVFGGTVIINDPAAIGAVIDMVSQHRDDIQLSAEHRKALEKAVADLVRGRDERKSEASVMREALTSIRHIFEHGAGAVIGHVAPEWLPVLSHHIDNLLNAMR